MNSLQLYGKLINLQSSYWARADRLPIDSPLRTMWLHMGIRCKTAIIYLQRRLQRDCPVGNCPVR